MTGPLLLAVALLVWGAGASVIVRLCAHRTGRLLLSEFLWAVAWPITLPLGWLCLAVEDARWRAQHRRDPHDGA